MELKTKERIGYGLYLVAIVLLIIHIYQMGADIENRGISITAWVSLIVASVYQIWLSTEKKKSSKSKIESEK